MNTYKKLTLILILILTSFGTYAQVSDSIFYNRLFYVCKAWGHVKYYHTETANGSVNWDDELLNSVSGLRNAPDNISFNDSLLLILNNAGEMGIVTGPLPSIPDSLNNNSDYTWIQNPIFSDPVKAILDTIKNRFRPQTNVYVDESFSGGSPTFDADDLYYTGSNFPDENKRILALFRYWNIINLFFPYKNIMDQNWDTTLVEFIPQIVEATDSLSYNLAFKGLTMRINDTHAFFYSATYWNWIGSNYPPFFARFIENETVITKVLPEVSELNVGDIIKEIDGVNIYSFRDSLRNYSHGSNDAVIERKIDNLVMRGDYGSFSVTVDDGISTHTESFDRNETNFSLLNNETGPIWMDTVVNEICTFGIVDMGRLEAYDVDDMFDDLWDTDAIIFDIRNYPKGTLWYIVDYLYPSSIHISNFATPDVTYPGRLYWNQDNIGSGTIDPYAGNIIILFDERTQSQAEYTCMGLEQFPDAIKIGSTTAAADGNIATVYLPGNMYTYATFLGTFYPDYTPTQRVGIIPDFEIHPTIMGVRAGEDEVMAFALNCNLVDIEETESLCDIKIYPNPAKDEIRYDFANDNAVLIELYNMQGRKLKIFNINSPSGSLDISELNEGVYLVKISFDKSIVSKLVIKH